MPLIGSCSAAISAACHPLQNDPDASLLPVMWGAVAVESEDAVGHCCFSSLEVSPPVDGKVYAGLKEETIMNVDPFEDGDSIQQLGSAKDCLRERKPEKHEVEIR